MTYRSIYIYKIGFNDDGHPNEHALHVLSHFFLTSGHIMTSSACRDVVLNVTFLASRCRYLSEATIWGFLKMGNPKKTDLIPKWSFYRMIRGKPQLIITHPQLMTMDAIHNNETCRYVIMIPRRASKKYPQNKSDLFRPPLDSAPNTT